MKPKRPVTYSMKEIEKAIDSIQIRNWEWVIVVAELRRIARRRKKKVKSK